MFPKKLLFLCIWSGLALAGKDLLFTVTDPRGDDFGSGAIHYPSGIDYEKGDLDLLEFSAERGKDGTWFEARFANKIRSPEIRTSKLGAVPLKDIARHGFYNFNIDIYIDTNGEVGNGRTDTLPGRNIRVADATAWEKGIFLTPNPMTAANWLETYLSREEEGGKEDRAAAKREMAEHFFFPNRIVVRGKSIRFFVPNSYLGQAASADWRYLVLVTGADPEQKTDISFFKQNKSGLMMMPVGRGRPFESFQLDFDADPNLPPIIDALLPDIELQRKLLASFDPEDENRATLAGLRVTAPDAAPLSAAEAVPALEPELKPKPGKPAGLVTIAEPKPPAPSERVLQDPPAPESEPVVASPPKRPIAPVPPPAAGADGRDEDLISPPRPMVAPAEPTRSVADRLRELEALRKDGLVSEQEYAELRKKILEQL